MTAHGAVCTKIYTSKHSNFVNLADGHGHLFVTRTHKNIKGMKKCIQGQYTEPASLDGVIVI